MTLPSSIKYRYSGKFLLFCLYYIMLLIVSAAKMYALYKYKSFGSRGEIFLASFVFAFAIGIISYKSDLKLFIQNGLSREKNLLSFICFLPVAVVMSVLDTLIYQAETLIVSKIMPEKIETMNNLLFDTLYGSRESLDFSTSKRMFLIFIAAATAYITVMSFGYMLSSVLYKFNAKQKTIILILCGVFFVGVYIAIVNILSYFDLEETKVIKFFLYFMVGDGYGGNMYWHMVVAFLVLTGCFVSVSALAGRKAEISK